MDLIEQEAKDNKLWGSIREFTLAERITRRVRKRDIIALADVGCGDGFLLYSILKERKGIKRVYGIDFSKTRLNRVSGISKKIKTVKADATSLPFENDFFDVVICSEVLEHIKDYKNVVRELLRVAKRQMIITVPNDQELMRTLCPKCKTYHYLAGHINSFDAGKLKAALISGSASKKIKIRFEKFHTVYTYNRLTKKFPRCIRIGMDRFFTSLEPIIPFLKPNYLMVIIEIS